MGDDHYVLIGRFLSAINDIHMGNRLNTYRILKQVHLYASFVIMVFLVMYFVTGFLLVRYNWFDHDKANEIPVETPDIEVPGDLETEILAMYMKEHLQIPGKLQRSSEQGDGGIFAQFTHPAAIYRLKVERDPDSISLTRQNLNAHQVIAVFHRLHGYGGGWIYNLYMFMMDLSSISLILFALTGIYLWLRALKKRFWGMIFLALGIIYTTIVIITFYYY